MEPRVRTLLFSGPDPNPGAQAAWRLAELEAWAVRPVNAGSTGMVGLAWQLPSWPAALRSYLAG